MKIFIIYLFLAENKLEGGWSVAVVVVLVVVVVAVAEKSDLKDI